MNAVATRPVDWRWLGLRLAFGILLVGVITEGTVFLMMPNVGPNQAIGDHSVLMTATQRWLAGGSFYPAYELSGPFIVAGADILYPPPILPLLTVFSFLPDILWWAVPIAIVAGVLAYWRPSLVGWTLILACIANPFTFATYAWGNPGMWFVAFVSLGTIYHWPAVLVFLKPTLFPFALIGIRHRSWWVALAVLVGVSVAFWPLWWDYLRVITNARGPFVSPLYSLPQVPIMLVPLIARWMTTRKAPTLEEAGAVVSAGSVVPTGS